MKRNSILQRLTLLLALALASSAEAEGSTTTNSFNNFSSVQGAGGWSYGVVQSSLGAGVYDYKSFTPMGTFSASTWTDAGGSGAFLSDIGASPGWGGGVWHLPVRRWKVSASGMANISASWQKPMSGGDGVLVAVYYNGMRVHALPTSANGNSSSWTGLTVAPFRVDAGNNYVDFVFMPRSDNAFDRIDLDATITVSPINYLSINVSHYGATGDGVTDDRPAIRSAINAAKALVEADLTRSTYVQITFPQGVYALKTAESACYFKLDGLTNINLHGGAAGDVEFLGSLPEKGFFELNSCRNMSFVYLTFDYDPLPFTQGIVTGVNVANNTFTWIKDNGYPSPTAPFFAYPEYRFYAIDGTIDLRNALKGIAPFPGNGITYLGNDIYSSQIDPSFQGLGGLQTITVGQRVSYQARYNTGVFVLESCGLINLQNNIVYSGPGTFVLEVLTDATYANQCRVVIRPGSGRLQTVTADGFHSVSARTGPWVTDCIFEAHGDDSINIRGVLTPTISVTSPSEIKSNETIWNLTTKYWRDGDLLEFYRASDGAYAGNAYINKLTPAGGGYDWKVSLSSPLTSSVATSGQPLVCSNANLCGNGHQIINNRARNHRASFAQIRSRSGGEYGLSSRIEGNVVTRTEGGIVVGMAYFYGEGPAGGDLRIAENTFSDIGSIIPAVIYVGDDQGANTSNRNIAIESNLFEKTQLPAFYVNNSSFVIFSQNVIELIDKSSARLGNSILTEFQTGPYASNITISSNSLTGIIFYDGFEQEPLTQRGWSVSGSNQQTAQKYAGNSAVQFRSANSLSKSLNTVGYVGQLQIQYARCATNCEPDDYFIVECSPNSGASWIQLESISGNFPWTVRTINLPSQAANNSNLLVRFRTQHHGAADNVFLDEVKISSVP